MNIEQILASMSKEDRDALLEQMREAEDILSGKVPRPNPDDCTHSLRQGNNYGESCHLCGANLAGFGVYGEIKNCIHVFVEGYCIYCEQSKEYVERSNA